MTSMDIEHIIERGQELYQLLSQDGRIGPVGSMIVSMIILAAGVFGYKQVVKLKTWIGGVFAAWRAPSDKVTPVTQNDHISLAKAGGSTTLTDKATFALTAAGAGALAFMEHTPRMGLLFLFSAVGVGSVVKFLTECSRNDVDSQHARSLAGPQFVPLSKTGQLSLVSAIASAVGITFTIIKMCSTQAVDTATQVVTATPITQ
jgi:hypothetical protein